jgi:transketolase
MTSETTLANAIRALSMDAVQAANSGHPGAPMGMADIAEVLWRDYLQHNPKNPDWANRDRFVLSNGHGSMLIYALLHLSGYDLPISELRNFRQLHSKTPGHPEYGMTPGVETTTGPLGQGLAMAVGMALAERTLGAQFNRPGYDLVDHYTYAFAGDGCLMEGISHEACSLAGVLGLGKLVVFYDDNGISIDGEVKGWFRDDTPKRFEAYGWHVIPKVDGHNRAEIKAAIEMARTQPDRPTLICCQTIIGFGSPNMAGTEEVHGKALGETEIAAARAQMGWTAEPFDIPEDVQAAWDASEKGAEAEAKWAGLLESYQEEHPELAAQWARRKQGDLPENWQSLATEMLSNALGLDKAIATRKASEQCLNVLGPALPELIGGSADLTGSNNTRWKAATDIGTDPAGQYVFYGVREFAMSAIMNSMALYGGFIPFGGTFLVFMDYAKNALRLSALMKQQAVYVYTHDSIGLGEDGPTHQPIEHLTALRSLPNCMTWRPADAAETAVAWQQAIERRDGPTSLALSRQNLPAVMKSANQAASAAKGAYEVLACESPDIIIMATGSEVHIALAAGEALQAQGHAVRVISMPCTECFDAQSVEYQLKLLPPNVRARVAVEAGCTDFWRKYVGLEGEVIGLDRFGESAPAGKLYEFFGITEEAIVSAAQRLVVRFAQ